MFIAHRPKCHRAPLGVQCDISLLTERKGSLGLCSYKHFAPPEQRDRNKDPSRSQSRHPVTRKV
jgi:hypothetical protein